MDCFVRFVNGFVDCYIEGRWRDLEVDQMLNHIDDDDIVPTKLAKGALP